MILLLIALGGAVGSVARYLLGRAVQGVFGLEFPTGTFVVNVLGCLIIGLLARFFMGAQTELPLRATLMIGFCGGFTTFSTFSLETLGLMQGGEWGKAAVYVVLSCLVCVGATAAGYALSRPLNP
jgi:CrcB protein